MYRTLPEIAKYIGMPLHQVQKYVLEGRIHAVHDGQQFLVNEHQFDLYFKQLEQIREQIEEWKNTPLPPDRDVKDED